MVESLSVNNIYLPLFCNLIGRITSNDLFMVFFYIDTEFSLICTNFLLMIANILNGYPSTFMVFYNFINYFYYVILVNSSNIFNLRSCSILALI